MLEAVRTAISAVEEGARLALAFNPLIAVVGSAIAAAVLATGKGARRAFAGVSIILGFWLVGDGLRALARVRDVADGVAAVAGWEAWVSLAVWAAGGLALGYALPAWAGMFAGRRVVLGTGWLTAITVSIGISFALAALASLGV